MEQISIDEAFENIAKAMYKAGLSFEECQKALENIWKELSKYDGNE